MTTDLVSADIRIEMEIRATHAIEPGKVPRVLNVLRESAGRLNAHLLYRVHDQWTAFFVCERPSEGALALQQEGIEVDTETVVTVRSRDRPGLLRFLVQTLEAEKIDVAYSYATVEREGILLVFRTSDNAKAEDVLRSYLIPVEADTPAKLPTLWPENRSS